VNEFATVAVKLLQPGIITLFALKVNLPATDATAVIALLCLKISSPAAIETVAVVLPIAKVIVVCVDEIAE
jgi:hypothetical protein